MALMSRVGLRQLIVLLVLASLLIAAGSMYWASNSLHQQALQEHEQQRQQGFARQLAARLEQRLQHAPLAEVVDALVIDEQMQLLIADQSGLLRHAQADSPQTAGLPVRQGTALWQDSKGRTWLNSAEPVPGTGLVLIVQSPVQAGSQPPFTELLVYSLPVALLLTLIAWLAGGSMARPFRSLASHARNLDKQDSLAVIGDIQPSTKEAAELKNSLMLGARRLRPQEPASGEDLDALTGLSKPDILPELVTNISLGGTSFAAVVLAVDDYEQISEHFASVLRDSSLKQLAELMLQHSRELDISVRLGEEVFLLLLPNCPLVIAQRIAERLRCKVEEHSFDGVGHMTISAGVAVHEAHGADPLHTLKLAQQQLIAARKAGQNRVYVMGG